MFFDIELLETEEGPQPVNVFKQIDMDNDAALSREELSVYLKQQVNKYRLLLLSKIPRTWEMRFRFDKFFW